MIDLENIPTDSEVTIKLPRLIYVDDYHDFKYYENILQLDFDIQNIVVEEVGYTDDGQYIGLAHLDTPEHQILARQLEVYLREE